MSNQKKPAITRVSLPTPATVLCLVTLTFGLWPFDPKRNGFPGIMVEHFCVKFGDPSCISIWDTIWKKNREINTNATKNPTVGVSSNLCWTVIDCDTFGMLFTVITRTVWCVRVLRERAWMLMSPTRLLRSATPWKRSSDVSHQTWQVA